MSERNAARGRQRDAPCVRESAERNDTGKANDMAKLTKALWQRSHSRISACQRSLALSGKSRDERICTDFLKGWEVSRRMNSPPGTGIALRQKSLRGCLVETARRSAATEGALMHRKCTGLS